MSYKFIITIHKIDVTFQIGIAPPFYDLDSTLPHTRKLQDIDFYINLTALHKAKAKYDANITSFIEFITTQSHPSLKDLPNQYLLNKPPETKIEESKMYNDDYKSKIIEYLKEKYTLFLSITEIDKIIREAKSTMVISNNLSGDNSSKFLEQIIEINTEINRLIKLTEEYIENIKKNETYVEPKETIDALNSKIGELKEKISVNSSSGQFGVGETRLTVSPTETDCNCNFVDSRFTKALLNMGIDEYIPFTEYLNITWRHNSCYINSTLQLLYSIKPFRDYFLTLNGNRTNLECALRKVFLLMYNRIPFELQNESVNGRSLYRIFTDIIRDKYYKLGNYVDVNDFIDDLNDTLEKTNSNHILNLIKTSYQEFKNCEGEMAIPIIARTEPTLLKLDIMSATLTQTTIQNFINGLNDVKENNPEPKERLDNSTGKLALFCTEGPSCGPETPLEGEKLKCAHSQYVTRLPVTENKYLIITLDRTSLSQGDSKISVTPNRVLHFGNNLYIISGCIIFKNYGHYVYMKFNKSGFPCGLLDDMHHDETIHDNYLPGQTFNYEIHARTYLYRFLSIIPDGQPIEQVILDATRTLDTIDPIDHPPPRVDPTRDRQKYLKYKQKYLKLKNKLNL